jgi:hypothetical protein
MATGRTSSFLGQGNLVLDKAQWHWKESKKMGQDAEENLQATLPRTMPEGRAIQESTKPIGNVESSSFPRGSNFEKKMAKSISVFMFAISIWNVSNSMKVNCFVCGRFNLLRSARLILPQITRSSASSKERFGGMIFSKLNPAQRQHFTPYKRLDRVIKRFDTGSCVRLSQGASLQGHRTFRILIADKISSDAIESFKHAGHDILNAPDLDGASLPASIASFDPHIVVVRSPKVTAAAIAAGPALEVLPAPTATYPSLPPSTPRPRTLRPLKCRPMLRDRYRHGAMKWLCGGLLAQRRFRGWQADQESEMGPCLRITSAIARARARASASERESERERASPRERARESERESERERARWEGGSERPGPGQRQGRRSRRLGEWGSRGRDWTRPDVTGRDRT